MEREKTAVFAGYGLIPSDIFSNTNLLGFSHQCLERFHSSEILLLLTSNMPQQRDSGR